MNSDSVHEKLSPFALETAIPILSPLKLLMVSEGQGWPTVTGTLHFGDTWNCDSVEWIPRPCSKMM